MKEYKDWLKPIENAIDSLYKDKDRYGLVDPMDYIISIGGKRIRPALVLMTYEMFKDDAEKIVDKAIIVEAFHNFTLMHDDIMDKAPVRRGKETVHIKWNTPTAILSGDAMLVNCYQMLANENKNVIYRFSEAAIGVCQGQMIDMDFETRDDVTVEEYIEMIRLKTGVLLGYSMELGAMLAGASEEDVANCYNSGEKMGLSFQIMDDLLDAFGEKALVGKQIGGDILADKKTILSLLAFQSANSDYEDVLKMQNPEEKVSAMLKVYENTGARQETENLMKQYYEEAVHSLEEITVDSNRKKALSNLFGWLFERGF